MATWEHTLAQSRYHTDRAQYKEACALLRGFIETGGPHRLDAVIELAKCLKNQGYCRRSLDILLNEVNHLSAHDGTEKTEEPLRIQMRMETCFLKMCVTASFDKPLEEAEELRRQTSDFVALERLEPPTIETALAYSKIRILSCQYHQPIAPADIDAITSWLKPSFDRLVMNSRYREAYELLQTCGVFFESGLEIGITSLDYDVWSEMAQRFIRLSDLQPLSKANAMALLAKKAGERLDEDYLAKIETTAKKIYSDQGHSVGAMDVRFQEISRVLKKTHSYLTDDLLEEVKGYFDKYRASDAIQAYHIAIQAVLSHIPQWLAFELQIFLSHENEELADRTGTVLFNHLNRIGLISRWLAHSGKAASAVEAAQAIHEALGEGDCRWLRGQAAYAASRAYAQLQDHRKAHEWAAKAVELFGEIFSSMAATSRNSLIQAKLDLSGEVRLEDTLSFADAETTRDINDGWVLQAAEKAQMIFGQVKDLPPEQSQYWKDRMTNCVNALSETGSAEEDVRVAGLCQVQGAKLTASIQQGDSEEWESSLAYFDRAVDLFLRHSRLVEAANTRQMQSVALYRKFQLSPSAELLQCCLDYVNVALDLFKELDNLAFLAKASRWRSIIMHTAWTFQLVNADEALDALGYAEELWAAERADMSAFTSFEAVSGRQHLTSVNALRQVYQYAFSICSGEGRIMELWEWTQKAKARSLSDQLGVDSLVPADLREQAMQDPSRKELIMKAERLSTQIVESPDLTRLRLRGELAAIHKQMKQDTLLSAIMDITAGTPVKIEQLQLLGRQMKRLSPDRDVKFVDWLEHSGRLWVLVLGCEAMTPTIMHCPISPNEVAAWKRTWLDARDGELPAFEEDDLYSEDDPEFSLRKLDSLVEPLAILTKPGDLLVFCPTGILHTIPLHALYVSSKLSVIERNPVIYSASLTTFWQCCRRGGLSDSLPLEESGSTQRSASLTTQWTMTSVLEDGQFDAQEQEEVYSLISSTAVTSHAQSATGTTVTKEFLLKAMQESTLFHFHGHCVFNRDVLADQSLELADDKITVRDIFDIKLKAPHITLIACDSASQGIAAGDEPLGIVTALLCAGAGSVLGTIWPTASQTGRYFTEEFYNNILKARNPNRDSSTDVANCAAIIDLAEVCQRTVLSLRRDMDTRHPYHWAAFVLHGSWIMYFVDSYEEIERYQ